jgi:hypothetical protein
VQVDNNRVLYLWDTEYNLNEKLSCKDFEIYEYDFFLVIGKQLYSHSPRIDCIKIDKTKKWKYMNIQGFPEHLSIESIEFDKLIDKINNVV